MAEELWGFGKGEQWSLDNFRITLRLNHPISNNHG
jgi:hypothetical protein